MLETKKSGFVLRFRKDKDKDKDHADDLIISSPTGMRKEKPSFSGSLDDVLATTGGSPISGAGGRKSSGSLNVSDDILPRSPSVNRRASSNSGGLLLSSSFDDKDVLDVVQRKEAQQTSLQKLSLTKDILSGIDDEAGEGEGGENNENHEHEGAAEEADSKAHVEQQMSSSKTITNVSSERRVHGSTLRGGTGSLRGKDAASTSPGAESPTVLSDGEDSVSSSVASPSLARKKIPARESIAREILSTERTYVESLSILKQVFEIPLREAAQEAKPVVEESDLRIMFAHLDPIYAYNSMFLQKLQLAIDADAWNNETTQLGPMFLELAMFLKTYSMYINNFTESTKLIDKLSKKKPRFKELLLAAKNDARTQQKGIVDYLIMPVQRIPRYILLLNDYLKHTPKEHVDYVALETAIAKINDVAHFINETKAAQDDFVLIKELQDRFIDPPYNLMLGKRKLIRQEKGVLVKLDGLSLPTETPMRIIFFSDCLIFAVKARQKLQIKHWFWLHEISKVEPDLLKLQNVSDFCIRLTEDIERTWERQHAEEEARNSGGDEYEEADDGCVSFVVAVLTMEGMSKALLAAKPDATVKEVLDEFSRRLWNDFDITGSQLMLKAEQMDWAATIGSYKGVLSKDVMLRWVPPSAAGAFPAFPATLKRKLPSDTATTTSTASATAATTPASNASLLSSSSSFASIVGISPAELNSPVSPRTTTTTTASGSSANDSDAHHHHQQSPLSPAKQHVWIKLMKDELKLNPHSRNELANFYIFYVPAFPSADEADYFRKQIEDRVTYCRANPVNTVKLLMLRKEPELTDSLGDSKPSFLSSMFSNSPGLQRRGTLTGTLGSPPEGAAPSPDMKARSLFGKILQSISSSDNAAPPQERHAEIVSVETRQIALIPLSEMNNGTADAETEESIAEQQQQRDSKALLRAYAAEKSLPKPPPLPPRRDGTLRKPDAASQSLSRSSLPPPPPVPLSRNSENPKRQSVGSGSLPPKPRSSTSGSPLPVDGSGSSETLDASGGPKNASAPEPLLIPKKPTVMPKLAGSKGRVSAPIPSTPMRRASGSVIAVSTSTSPSSTATTASSASPSSTTSATPVSTPTPAPAPASPVVSSLTQQRISASSDDIDSNRVAPKKVSSLVKNLGAKFESPKDQLSSQQQQQQQSSPLQARKTVGARHSSPPKTFAPLSSDDTTKTDESSKKIAPQPVTTTTTTTTTTIPSAATTIESATTTTSSPTPVKKVVTPVQGYRRVY